MNLSALKTPGVYINEVNAFPPSVAQVATVPAFIGYTAINSGEIAKVNSFVEFEQIFGTAPEPKNVSVVLDDLLNPHQDTAVEESIFKLYNSLKLFYANGGGVCYIASVGTYKNEDGSTNTLNKEAFLDGLSNLNQIDEPTIIAMPDAVGLTADALASLQQSVLLQCATLKDRFAILDVQEQKHAIKSKMDYSIEQFRDKIGSDDLKYGAAYYPHLICNFDTPIRFKNIQWSIVSGGSGFASVLASGFSHLVGNYSALQALYSESKTIQDNFKVLDANESTTITSRSDYQSESNTILSWLKIIDDNNALQSVSLKNSINDSIKNVFNNYLTALFQINTTFSSLKAADNEALTAIDIDDSDFDTTIWSAFGATYNADNSPYANSINSTVETTQIDYLKLQNELKRIKTALINSWNNLIQKIEQLQLFEEQNLTNQLPFYKSVIQYLSNSINTLPPSGAIAGIYANTDSTRGIWKAPANVSLKSVIALTDTINDAGQSDMNIHQSGKSINAIRKFSGKGLLVWGARTLDGNSNDWRYINVRRLAIMIEESAKNACMNFVFEPNVSQTWVNVKAMLENYLTVLWNDGALAGEKPEHAFFVQVGLNHTMTSNDINEGRMIVKIGYAPSRPAEFIILEFKQMQQRS